MTSLSRAVNAWIVSRTLFSFQCYDLGARSWIVPSQVLTKSARMLRFLTPTEDWKGRGAGKVSLGFDVRTVQQHWMGHKSLERTMRYLVPPPSFTASWTR
jgi:hypothetical protein